MNAPVLEAQEQMEFFQDRAPRGHTVTKVEPGARLYSRNILFGIAVTLKNNETGVSRTLLVPSHWQVRDRSKYKPHQGAREMERRRVGGFAFVRRHGAVMATVV